MQDPKYVDLATLGMNKRLMVCLPEGMDGSNINGTKFAIKVHRMNVIVSRALYSLFGMRNVQTFLPKIAQANHRSCGL